MTPTTLWDRPTLTAALDELVAFLRRIPVDPVMSLTAVTALRAVVVDGPLRISDIAERLGVSQPGATQLIDRMADVGHVERMSDENDGRVVLVRATEAGHDALTQRNASRDHQLADLIAQLPRGDQERIAAAVPSLLALTQLSEVAV